MKKIKFAVLALAGMLSLGSCSLNEAELYDQKDGESAFSTLKDISNGMNGAYYYLGHYGFLGNYATSLGDFAAGISMGSESSGHFAYISKFTFTDTEEEFEYAWLYGYKVIASATNTINGAKTLLAEGKISETDQPDLYNYIAQCYALKALANYTLVNLFALPYSEANKNQMGIVVIDKVVPQAFEQVQRGTIAQTYDQIVNDIDSAEVYFIKADENAETSAYYMGPMGLMALKARVNMALGNYDEAQAAAIAAITINGTGSADVDDTTPSDAKYLAMWGSTAENEEDLFCIKKAEDDNLSANSISTLYNSYYCTIQNSAIALFGDNDIRAELLKDGEGGGTTTSKYDGASALDVCNIRIFRKSEMALILAEVFARQNDIDNAKKYLMYTAKRDKAIASVDDLPNTTDELLQFISEERIREFYGEGHRFADARRMGDIVSGDQFSNWDIKKFCFPIPQAEINSGFGCKQNDGWYDNLPF